MDLKTISRSIKQALFKSKIEVFVRTCNYSHASSHKKRPQEFSHEKCLENLIQTSDLKRVNITFFHDAFHPSKTPHYSAKQERFSVVEFKEGTEAGSFLKLLEHVVERQLDPDTILYFVEDDYWHREGWVDVLLEGFTLPDMSYLTLYDHRDKYFHPNYDTLASKIFHTKSCHWRTTPSTTNTYSMRFKTLLRDLEIHRQFSLGRKITADHDKFCRLAEAGATLISPMPAWSTHLEPDFLSPCISWESQLLSPKGESL
jgi:glycosyltransferase involved in cell wall biosynthesis